MIHVGKNSSLSALCECPHIWTPTYDGQKDFQEEMLQEKRAKTRGGGKIRDS